jgi:hypothetical protein
VLSIAILSLCALPQEPIEPAPVAASEQQLSVLIGKATSDQAASELRQQLRALSVEWPVLPSRLLEATLLAQPENNPKITAAIRLAGELGSTDDNLLRRLSALLDSRQFAAVSRSALSTICGREFVNGSAFNSWYENAQGQGREVWLETVLQQQWQQQEQLWRQRLIKSPSVAVITFAMQNSRRAVREIAFISLANLDTAAINDGQLNLVAAAFRDALESESDLQLRVQLLQQTTRFIAGQEALNLLLPAIKQGKPNEATEASRQLAFIEPSASAWQALIWAIDGSYATGDKKADIGSVNAATRLALWTGLSSLDARPPDVTQATIDVLLQRGLSQESDQAVLEKIYVCAGRQAGIEFLPILEAVVLDKQRDPLHRSVALLSMTSITERAVNAPPISTLVINLLGDTEAQVRAQAIVALRRLNPDGATEELADRLSQETQIILQKQLLNALLEERSALIFEPLLLFVPPTELIEGYSRALVFQISADIALLTRAVDALSLRQSFQTSLMLVRAFPLDKLSLEATAILQGLHAKVLSEHLLTQSIDESNQPSVDDALLRLRDLQSANPTEGSWLEYEIQLRLLDGDVTRCIDIVSLLAASDSSTTAKWTLALDIMSAASEQNIADAANTVRVAMMSADALPAELEFRASQLFDLATPPQLRDDDAEQDQAATE